MTKRAATIILLINCSALYGANADAGDKTEPPLNVILITISTLRADHVGALGYERDTTPRLDAFAKENILFRNAFATSGWTMPAHGSIFTSLYPGRHGATHIDKKLSDEHLTLAEILSENGFYCTGFSCNPRLNREYGYALGFDFYDDFSVSIMLESLTFGIEKGPLVSMMMYGQREYIGRALNIACRLQSAIKDKDKSPAYKALVSNVVYNEYFASASKQLKVYKVKRKLRNIRGGVDFLCKKVHLLNQKNF